MKIKSVFLLITLVIFVFSAEASVVSPLSVELVGVGNSQVRYGAYSGLYELKINNTSTILAMCDDKLTNVFIGETWTANKFTFSQIQAGAPAKFASLGVEKYSQAGYLFSLLKDVSYSDQADINLAIWNIMSPGSVAMTSVASVFYNTATSGLYDGFDFGRFGYVLTPNPLDASQEYFIISEVPIPSAVLLFGSGMLGVVGVSRRKKVVL